jgi:hypothetical protein
VGAWVKNPFSAYFLIQTTGIKFSTTLNAEFNLVVNYIVRVEVVADMMDFVGQTMVFVLFLIVNKDLESVSLVTDVV